MEPGGVMARFPAYRTHARQASQYDELQTGTALAFENDRGLSTERRGLHGVPRCVLAGWTAKVNYRSAGGSALGSRALPENSRQDLGLKSLHHQLLAWPSQRKAREAKCSGGWPTGGRRRHFPRFNNASIAPNSEHRLQQKIANARSGVHGVPQPSKACPGDVRFWGYSAGALEKRALSRDPPPVGVSARLRREECAPTLLCRPPCSLRLSRRSKAHQFLPCKCSNKTR